MSKYKQRIKGGRAKALRPSDFDPIELERGIAVEREHTGRRDIAREIAMDHLAERADYYEVHAAAGLNPSKERSKKKSSARKKKKEVSADELSYEAATLLEQIDDNDSDAIHRSRGPAYSELQDLGLIEWLFPESSIARGRWRTTSKGRDIVIDLDFMSMEENPSKKRSKKKSSARKNPRSRQPSGDPVLAIRTYPGGIFGASRDIYLLTNAKGETVDAISTNFEDFGPMEASGYGDLPILELEVSGGQFRQLEVLAKQLQATVAARPKYRPSRAESRAESRRSDPFGMTRALNNPRKRKLMGSKA